MLVLLPRMLPDDTAPREQGTVELLMVEQKGSEPSPGEPPKATTPAEPADAPKAEVQPKVEAPPGVEARADEPVAPRSEAAAVPSTVAPGSEPVPPPTEQPELKAGEPKAAEAKPVEPATGDAKAVEPAAAEPHSAEPAAPDAKVPPQTKAAAAQPVTPRSQEALDFDLGGTDSLSNAVVLGDKIVPALKDDRFRNRPPIYPIEAEIRGEHGSVVVVIHVSEDGLATGADIQESSGYDVLDQAAVTAVRKWHFRPAMEGGRSVPFDMPFRFVFEAN